MTAAKSLVSQALGPDLSHENIAQSAGHTHIAGTDEVGRGPLAGPVTAAAVILNFDNIPNGLNDSKKLTAAKREALFDLIYATSQVSVAHASVAEIDAVNIRAAAHLAMERAVAGLSQTPDYLLVDGNVVPSGISQPAAAIIKGDAKSLSIAAASIVAKVTRDRLMVDLAQQHPGYGWEQNMGYPTKSHISALNDLGVTPHHRRSFAPVHKMLFQENF